MIVRDHHISLPMIVDVSGEKTSFSAGAQEATTLHHEFTEHIPKSAIMTCHDISTLRAGDSGLSGAGVKKMGTSVVEREKWEAEAKREGIRIFSGGHRTLQTRTWDTRHEGTAALLRASKKTSLISLWQSQLEGRKIDFVVEVSCG